MAELTKNFAVSTVATAPSPATSGTSLVVAAGEGTRFDGAVDFNAVVCPADAQPTPSNAEIVRVTAISTDTFTITRAQESSGARSIVVGDRIYAGPTVKTLTDLEEFATALQTLHAATSYHPTTQTDVLTIPIFENAAVQNGSPYSNNVPGWTAAAAGFTVINGQVIIPQDSTEANMTLRVLLGSTSTGNAVIGMSFLKLADGGTLTTTRTSITAQTVALTANVLEYVDFATSSAATRGSLLDVRVQRDGDNASDTLAASAYIQGLYLVYSAKV